MRLGVNLWETKIRVDRNIEVSPVTEPGRPSQRIRDRPSVICE